MGSKKKTCVWVPTPGLPKYWDTSCKNDEGCQEYLRLDASPTGERMKYCCFCGLPISERKSK